jgi:hypothetical protein
MDPITQQVVLAAAGTSATDPTTYVDDVFSTYVYEGSGSARTITNGIDLSGEGGLVWIKSRDGGYDHHLTDTVRGATKYLKSNSTAAENTYSTGLTAFGSNSFTLGSGSSVNASSSDYVSWTFRRAPGFFDVVTYDGSNSIQTIAHSLGSKPGMIFVKRLDNTGSWHVFHENIPINDHLRLETTAAINIQDVFNNTEPTSTHFTVMGNNGDINQLNGQYVAYLFANDDARFGTNSDESIIKCGTYEGNNGTQEINLGFEPQWLMLKNVDDTATGANWIMVDVMRGFTGYGTTLDSNSLCANLSNGGEPVNGGRVKVTPQGFIFDNEANYDYNQSGDTFIYMAIRRPNKPPTTGTDVFAIDTYGGTAPSPPTYNSGFPVDMAISKFDVGSSRTIETGARLMGENFLGTNTDAVQTGDTAFKFDYNNGWRSNTGTSTVSYSWMFKRAPGFFDVVAYEGTGSVRTIPHNLNAVPELMLVKPRQLAYNWLVYSSVTGNDKRLYLDQTYISSNTSAWNYTTPTASVFTVSAGITANTSGSSHIAYLFATLPGISKVGSYSGSTGSNVDVDCGFTAGARFVLIKRTDDTAHWILWDTTRGIVSGNDPFILLSSTAAQNTNFDYIDPLSSGFTITSSAPSAINATGGTYLFLAIA